MVEEHAGRRAADAGGRGTDDARERETADAGKRTAADAAGRAGRSAAVFFVGNKLMLDEGVGPAAYEELQQRYDVPGNVALFDVGCMSMDMLPYVRDCDVVLTVDAVDGTGEEPGTVFRFPPDAMARAAGARASLHDLKLADLFDAAVLLGYEAEGYCLGMQVENMSPAEYMVGLTPKVLLPCPFGGGRCGGTGAPGLSPFSQGGRRGACWRADAGGRGWAERMRCFWRAPCRRRRWPCAPFCGFGCAEGADAPRNGASSGE